MMETPISILEGPLEVISDLMIGPPKGPVRILGLYFHGHGATQLCAYAQTRDVGREEDRMNRQLFANDAPMRIDP